MLGPLKKRMCFYLVWLLYSCVTYSLYLIVEDNFSLFMLLLMLMLVLGQETAWKKGYEKMFFLRLLLQVPWQRQMNFFLSGVNLWWPYFLDEHSGRGHHCWSRSCHDRWGEIEGEVSVKVHLSSASESLLLKTSIWVNLRKFAQIVSIRLKYTWALFSNWVLVICLYLIPFHFISRSNQLNIERLASVFWNIQGRPIRNGALMIAC